MRGAILAAPLCLLGLPAAAASCPDWTYVSVPGMSLEEVETCLAQWPLNAPKDAFQLAFSRDDGGAMMEALLRAGADPLRSFESPEKFHELMGLTDLPSAVVGALWSGSGSDRGFVDAARILATSGFDLAEEFAADDTMFGGGSVVGAAFRSRDSIKAIEEVVAIDGWPASGPDRMFAEALCNGELDASELTWILDQGATLASRWVSAPLALAALCRREMDVIEMLLSRGADLVARDEDGLTAFHYMAEQWADYAPFLARAEGLRLADLPAPERFIGTWYRSYGGQRLVISRLGSESRVRVEVRFAPTHDRLGGEVDFVGELIDDVLLIEAPLGTAIFEVDPETGRLSAFDRAAFVRVPSNWSYEQMQDLIPRSGFDDFPSLAY